jgi:hypothetical protein
LIYLFIYWWWCSVITAVCTASNYFTPCKHLYSNHHPLVAIIKNVFVTTKLLTTRWTRELTDTSLMLQVYSPTGFEKYACTYTVGDYRIHFVVWDTSGKFHKMGSA